MITTAEEGAYKTMDLGLSAFLLANGIELLELGGSPGSRRVFTFPPRAATLVAAYYRGGHVPARAYFNNIRDLKALVKTA